MVFTGHYNLVPAYLDCQNQDKAFSRVSETRIFILKPDNNWDTSLLVDTYSILF